MKPPVCWRANCREPAIGLSGHVYEMNGRIPLCAHHACWPIYNRPLVSLDHPDGHADDWDPLRFERVPVDWNARHEAYEAGRKPPPLTENAELDADDGPTAEDVGACPACGLTPTEEQDDWLCHPRDPDALSDDEMIEQGLLDEVTDSLICHACGEVHDQGMFQDSEEPSPDDATTDDASTGDATTGGAS